MCGERT
jgi:hypothetical protein